MKSLNIFVADTQLTLLPQRAIWWEQEKTLFVADVHLGKDATFQQNNIRLNNRQTADILNRLSTVLTNYDCERLVILGDWLHAQQGMTEETMSQLDKWYGRHNSIQKILVLGNHDERIQNMPDAPNLNIVSEPYPIALFTCWHYPHNDENIFSLSGHLHPNFALRGKGRQVITLPCFWQQSHGIVLPAFTKFSGKKVIKPDRDDIVYIATEQQVFAL